jgi:hypothetical protein
MSLPPDRCGNDPWENGPQSPKCFYLLCKPHRFCGLFAQFYERGDRRRLPAEHAPKIARVLAQLDIATDVNDMDLPGFHPHPLRGTLPVLERHCSRQLADHFPLR